MGALSYWLKVLTRVPVIVTQPGPKSSQTASRSTQGLSWSDLSGKAVLGLVSQAERFRDQILVDLPLKFIIAGLI